MPFYKNAPLLEAIIDFRVRINPEQAQEISERLLAVFGGVFTKSEPKRQFGIEWQIAGNVVPTPMPERTVGYRFDNEPADYCLQVTADGFTLSSLPPYPGWEHFSDQARKLWGLYVSATNADTVTRIAVRYIGQITFPQEDPIEDYLRIYPATPSDLPGSGIAIAVTQFQVPQPDINSHLVINQTGVEEYDNHIVSVSLDFDLFRNVEWSTNDTEQLWTFLEVLRNRKNDVFESVITDRTRERIS